MGLTRTAIRRPLATIMVFLALILMGQQAYTRLRVDRFPNITFPVVFAVINWPGASPEDIEQQILVPAENAAAGLSGVDRIESQALEGTGRLVIRFVEGTDLDQATIDTQRRLAAIGRLLPIDATQPSISKADPSAIPIMNGVRRPGARGTGPGGLSAPGGLRAVAHPAHDRPPARERELAGRAH
jgi:HAE1 family hydrophobic/amphiphilic exporter-1